MIKATVANLDFEYELAATHAYQPSPIMCKVSEKWRSILRLLPDAHDADTHGLERLETHAAHPTDTGPWLAWGVTPRFTQMLEHTEQPQEFPEHAVIREVNDKRFSHHLEQTLNVALPHSCIVETSEELLAAVSGCPHGWLLKHPFGVSGRERVIGKPQELTEAAMRWARKQFQRGWSLVFEPWVQDKQDASLHLEILPDGEISVIGYCELITDHSGTHRGNQVDPSHEPPCMVVETGIQAAKQMARLGYWGTVGIDVLSGRLGEQPVLKPIVEINARISFGRLTLALQRWLPERWCYLWWHPTETHYQQLLKEHSHLPALHPNTTEPGLYTLPPIADPDLHSHTVVLIAPTARQLNLQKRQLKLNPVVPTAH